MMYWFSFNECLNLSDQRKSFIVKQDDVMMRFEKLPTSSFNDQNGLLSEDTIDENLIF